MLREKREGGREENRVQIKVDWLMGGNETRKQRKGRGYQGFQEKERRNSGGEENKMLTHRS